MRKLTAADLGIAGSGKIYHNLSVPKLIELSLNRKEGTLSETGALLVETDKYTGRSPHDKFIVDTEAVHDSIDWGDINVPIDPAHYVLIREKMLAYLQGMELFVFDGYAGNDNKYSQKFRIINELASQNLFVHQLLVCRDESEEEFVPDYTIIVAPDFKCIPEVDGVNSEAAIIINYEAHEVLIAGSRYSGEIKKSVFSVMNYILPQQGVLPMHCSANIGEDGKSALFFGLSGTGKTTLSTAPGRRLIGDDEHGWSSDGIFNIEGGCYAKCIHLKRESEPDIYNAIGFGAVLENVVADEDGKPDYDDASITENSRAAYPIENIPNAVVAGKGELPDTVIFLTADAFGVLPPIAKLNNEAAMYHFMSGYTGKLAGTECGINEPTVTFSALFGAPFFPMKPSLYASMLGEKIKAGGVNVFLVNTGWCGGMAGDVPRIKLEYTRKMIEAAINGDLDYVEYETDPIFNLPVPKVCRGVPEEMLKPESMWKDKDDYMKAAKTLAGKFVENFLAKYPDAQKSIADAGPKII